MIIKAGDKNYNGSLEECLFSIQADLSDLELFRTWALSFVAQQAKEQEEAIDTLVSGNFVRAIMLNTEIVTYFQAGRPASPSATVYVIANALAVRRGITLRNMLELLLTRWRDVQSRIAVIITVLDRATEDITAAVTVAEMVMILSGLSW